jgi:hypothetical protein
MRLPDLIYRPLEQLYFRQRDIRRAELRHAVAEYDRRLRASADALYERHTAGTCGGQANGCYYVPCVPKVDP